MIPSRLLVIAPLLAAIVAGCAGDDDDTAASEGASDGTAAGDGATVVATTSVWASVLDSVTCHGAAGVDVTGLIPPQVDPHRYEASLQDRQTLEAATVVVANGLDLEAGFVDLLDEVADDRLVEVAALPGVEVHEHGEETGDGHEHAEETGEVHEQADEAADGHEHGEGDPHIWLDPQLVAGLVTPLGERIAERTGADAATIERCAAEYVDELRALDEEIAGLVESLPADRRVLVTNHDAYGYFAERYGFEVAGTVIPGTSTMAETNPADLAELARTIEDAGVPAIFVDAGHSAADADALAQMVGVDVVALDTEAVGAEGGADTYVTMMRTNATAIVEALQR